MHYYFDVLRKYFVFSGRARRSEYWYFTLFYALTLMVLAMVDFAAGTFNASIGFGWLSGAFFVLTFLPMLGVSVRRLHDIGRNGFWVLLDLVPGIGSLILMVIATFDSQPGNNAHGPNPKAQLGSPPESSYGEFAATPKSKRWLVRLAQGVAVFAGVMLVLAAAGAYWWNQNSDKIMLAGKAATYAGRDSGSSLDESGCVAKALANHKADHEPSMISGILSGLWLNGCLQTSQAQPTFCQDVPRQDEVIAASSWLNESCQLHGLNDAFCRPLLQNVPIYCASATRLEKIANGGKSATKI